MENPASILNPNNPLIDSEEEDDDFEPGKIAGRSVMVVETPVTNDGLFVTTRSGKGGNLNDSAVLDDVDVSLKRRAATLFEEMVKEDQMESERIRKKPKLQDVVIWSSFHTLEIQRTDDNGTQRNRLLPVDRGETARARSRAIQIHRGGRSVCS